MPLSTALGCALSAVTGAFAAVRPPLEAAAYALAVYGAAGAEAGARCSGPGHLPAELCDALYRHGRGDAAPACGDQGGGGRIGPGIVSDDHLRGVILRLDREDRLGLRERV